ncbi:MAG: nitroreductase family protein [Bacteroidales bacterium]|nr:nitroreductase family protein [Bacteroidales bacterium]
MNELLLPAIRDRYSPMIFGDRKISETAVYLLFEAARWAPSSFNEQPWAFVYTTDDQQKGYEQFLSLLTAYNRDWASSAPLLILSLTKKRFALNGKDNSYALHDTGMAVGNLILQASFMGMQAHQMGGYDKAKARETLNISEEYIPCAIIAVGYPGNPYEAAEPYRERALEERVRNPVSDFVFKERMP